VPSLDALLEMGRRRRRGMFLDELYVLMPPRKRVRDPAGDPRPRVRAGTRGSRARPPGRTGARHHLELLFLSIIAAHSALRAGDGPRRRRRAFHASIAAECGRVCAGMTMSGRHGALRAATSRSDAFGVRSREPTSIATCRAAGAQSWDDAILESDQVRRARKGAPRTPSGGPPHRAPSATCSTELTKGATNQADSAPRSA